MRRRSFLATACGGIAAAALHPPINAQQGAARVLVGFAPGGTGDFVARTLADHMRAVQYAPQVIVENRPGAGGVIAVQAVKAALPDGLTLLNTPASVLTILPHTHKRPPFDALRDVVPVATVSDLDFAIVVGASTPATSLGELMALVRRDRKVAIYGTAGVGTMSHVIGVMLARRAGIEWVHAPYRGGNAALQDVLGGQLPVAILSLGETMLRAHREGRVRLLATSGARRSRYIPDVPTIEDVGYKGVVASDWNTVVAPPGTPEPLLERAAKSIAVITGDPTFATALGRMCIDPLKLPRDMMAVRLEAEHQAMGQLVRDEFISIES